MVLGSDKRLVLCLNSAVTFPERRQCKIQDHIFSFSCSSVFIFSQLSLGYCAPNCQMQSKGLCSTSRSYYSLSKLN